MLRFFNWIMSCSVLILVTSCVQTRTRTTNNQKLNEFNRPEYIGTFATVYYKDWKNKIIVDAQKTIISISRNDSVIKKRVKNISFSKQNIDSSSVRILNSGLSSTLDYFKTNEKIKGFVSPTIFAKIGKDTQSTFNLYFISIGSTKDTITPTIKTVVNAENAALTVLWLSSYFMPNQLSYEHTYVSMLIYASQLPKNYKTPQTAKVFFYKEEFSGRSSFDNKKGLKGLKGFVIIYDKSKNEICYVREQFFETGKNPVNLNAIKKQIKHAFKEIYI